MRRFITDASHELRTPLTTIRGFAELYRQGAARDVEMLMSRIESESRRMGLLVEDLLLLARLDAQRPLDRHRVDLLALASDSVHDARSIAPKRDDHHGGLRRPGHAGGARRRGPAASGAGQPGRQRAAAHPGVRADHGAGRHRRRQRRARGRRRGSRHERRRTPTASSSGSTAPTHPATAPAAAPGWGCRSSTRWSMPTAARSASPPHRAWAAGSR